MTHLGDVRRREAVDHILATDWIREVQWLGETDSTNSEARRAIETASQPLPALWLADRQTSGRGRNANQWWSPPGCLMMSLAVSEDQLPSDRARWPELSLVTGVALACAAEELTESKSMQLKWPNDLYCRGRKVAGILVEAVSTRGAASHQAWIIGIGVNVAVPWQEAEASLRDRATCLSSISARPITLEQALVVLLENLQREYSQWQAGESEWHDEWSGRSLLTGRCMTLRLPGEQSLAGRCEGIDPFGRLLIRDARELHTIQAAEILDWDR